MKEKLKPMSQAFIKNAIGLDGIINALTRTAPTPPVPPEPTVWAKVHFAAPPAGWPGLGDHDGEDTVTLASINEVVSSEYYSATSYKIENGVVSVYLSPFNEVVSPGEDGDWWEVFTIDSNKNVTASGTGTTKAYLVDDDQNQDTFPEYDVYVMITDSSYTHVGEKCLLGFNLGPDTATYDGGNISQDPHILKQTNIDPNFQYALSLPEELQSYWDEYGCEEYPGGANFFTIYTEEGGSTVPYGYDVSVVKYAFNLESDEEYGCNISHSWGDSNDPYIEYEIISKAEAEEFYNS